MRVLVFLHGTTIMHPTGAAVSREERVEQSRTRATSVLEFDAYVPIGNAAAKLTRWHDAGAEIVYLSSHRNRDDVAKDERVLREHSFPPGAVVFRRDDESYADVAAGVAPDVIVEDDCESIGGFAQTTGAQLAGRAVTIPVVRVPEFGGIDELPDDPAALRAGSGLRGALAAALTPLRDGGEALDEDAFAPYVDFLAAGGIDGLLALGTTGEGMLLPQEQRMHAAQLFIEAARGRVQVAVHCGAQSTWDTVELAAHAAERGADAVAVIAPPYFPLDADELLAHFTAAARACAPTPFYVYEFAARSGYAVPVEVLTSLREEAPNFRGLKVSDTPWERFTPYLLEGLDVFVGPEALIQQGLAAGATGIVSALGSAFPERIAAALRNPASADLGLVRAAVQRFPFQAALKAVVAHRDVPMQGDVRQPLRTLTEQEREELVSWLESLLPAPAR